VKIYAVETTDRWTHWHVARLVADRLIGSSVLAIFTEKRDATMQAEKWKRMEARNGSTQLGIRYRVMTFNKDRIEIRKRKRPIK
jgi:hypothetical protein